MISNCEPNYRAGLCGANARFAQTDAAVPPIPSFAPSAPCIFIAAAFRVRNSRTMGAVAAATVPADVE
jgi:hypothetical protein